MTRFRSIILQSLVGMLITAPSGSQAGDGDEAPWEAVSIGTARIAVPRGWRNFDKIKPNMPLYRGGDGIGVPALDETDAPLQIGMTVEKFDGSKESVKEIMNGLVEAAKRAPRLALVGKESVETIKLSDGTEAMLLKAEFIKEGRRRSLQMKVVTKDADSNAWIVSGHVVGGKDSKLPTLDSDWGRWLSAHLASFSLDGTKFDAEKVDAAYKNRDQK